MSSGFWARRCAGCERAGSGPVEFSPGDGVVGGGGGAAGIEVDIGFAAAGGQRGGGEYVIDAPAEVALKGIAEIIPVGVLDAVGMKLTEDIDEAPGDGAGEGVAGIDVEVDVVDAVVGVVDVDGFGSDVHIAGPDGGGGGIEPLFEIGADALEPLELERVLVGADFVALGNVSIHDGDTGDDGLEDADVFAVGAFAEAVEDGLGLGAAEGGDPVVAFHSSETRVVSGVLDFGRGELGILDFGFLEAEDVGLMAREPIEEDGEAPADGVDVPGGEFHEGYLLV